MTVYPITIGNIADFLLVVIKAAYEFTTLYQTRLRDTSQLGPKDSFIVVNSWLSGAILTMC